jgi:isopenicillin-N epimerase
MGIAPLPASNLAALKNRLYREHKIEAPLIQWQDQQFVRISVQGYNSQEDVDALVNALQILLPQVAISEILVQKNMKKT